MADYLEQVKKLREKAGCFDYDGRPDIACDYEQAADAIEKLQKERNVWKATAEDWQDAYHHWFENYQKDVPQWIPVTERLPECEWGAEVGNIEWISYGKVDAGCFGRGGKYRDAYFRTWRDGKEGVDAKDVDAWRIVTLPESLTEKTNTKLETAKKIIAKHYHEANCGLFDCRNYVGDPMNTIYDDGELTIDICYSWAYFEVFGLSDNDFAELKKFYDAL